MKHTPIGIYPLNGGTQKLYRFPNNMGASVVRHSFSYGREQGLWELAVIKFLDKEGENFKLDYTTPITDDVLDSLTDEQVEETLTVIEAL